MTDWTRRVHRSAMPQEVQQVRDAAQDLARQASRAPGKVRVVFQTVADVALIGTAVLSGALAAVTLWKALVPRHGAHHPSASASGDSDAFPHRRRAGISHHDRANKHPPNERY